MVVWMFLAGCGATGPCGGDFADNAVSVTGLPAKYRSEASAQVLAESCVLPEPVVEALRGFPAAPPDYRPMLDLQLAADDVASWSAACPAGPAALVEVSTTGDRFSLWEACELERLGVFTRPELATMDLVVAPIVTAHLLQEAGAPPMETRWLVRMLAGLAPQ